jgi:hypothetical protein
MAGWWLAFCGSVDGCEDSLDRVLSQQVHAWIHILEPW